MKKFFSDYLYSCLKMFVTQIAISIFGFSLAIAIGDSSKYIQYAVSGFAVLFYLCLIYSIPWNHGAQDRLSWEYGKRKKNLLTGLYMGLVANSINIIVALVAGIASLVGATAFSAFMTVSGLWMQGMYTGLMQIKIGYFPLNSFWWMYIIATIPAILTSAVAYIAGFNNFRVFKFKEIRKN